MPETQEVGYRFREPAQKTINFMEKVTTEMTDLKVKIEGLTKDINYVCRNQELGVVEAKRVADANDKGHSEIIKKMDDFIAAFDEKQTEFAKNADDKYANNEQFLFWRNLLISGMIVLGVLSAIGIFLDKYLGK